jgi:acylphosphatase
MPASASVVRRLFIEGFVQGVGYRHFAWRAARNLGVSGWVRNRADGTVEALVSGRPDAVEAMLAELRRGPSGAGVRNLRLVATGDADWAEGTFEVRPTA